MAADLDFWKTSLVLNFSGSNLDTSTTDISPTPKTATFVADAKISTGAAATGATSLLLDGTGDYIHFADHANFQYGTGELCIEFWFRPAAGTGTQYGVLAQGKPTVATNADLSFYAVYQTTGKMTFQMFSGTTGYAVNGNVIGATGVWAHYACTREGDVLKLWVNGVQDGFANLPAAASINSPVGQTLRIGTYHTGATLHANGYVDGVRITKGTERYPVAFTPDSSLFEVTLPGTGTVNVSAPMGTMVGNAGPVAELTAPMGFLAPFTGAVANLTAPSGQLYAAGHDTTGEREFNGVAPMGTLTALAGTHVALSAPMGTLVSSITVPISVRAALVAPMGEVSASGTVTTSVRADLRLTSAGTLVAYAGAASALSAPSGTLSAIATAGIIAHFAGGAPMGTLQAAMTTGIVVTADLVAPMIEPTPGVRAALTAPMGYLVAVGRTVIAVTYEAYAINLKPGDSMPHQVTRYTGMPFNQIIRHKNAYYGVADDGLYLLGGSTDDGAAIAWGIETGITDFGSSKNKVVRETFIGGRMGTTVSAFVSVGEAADVTYAAQLLRGSTAQNHRVKYGKGLGARYWSFGFEDAAGSEINIDTLEFDARETGGKL
jgi:hypothetical protein